MKKVKLTNNEVEQILVRLQKIVERELPFTISWKIRKNIGVLTKGYNQYEEFKTEINSDFFSEEKSFLTPDENGNPTRTVKEEYQAEFLEQITECSMYQDEYNIDMVEVKEFEKLDNFTVFDCETLSFMIEDNME